MWIPWECVYLLDNIWASTRENLSSEVCERHRRRPACAFTQSNQRLCYSLIVKYHIQAWYKRNFNFLASLCSWAGWFESRYVGNPEDRFSRVAAHLLRTSDGGNGNHSVSLPIILIKIKVDQMIPSSYVSSLMVSILWFCIWFPISMNVRLYFGAKMVHFCIIHIGNRKIFLKHHSPPPPEFQLILLHVSVFSYFT